MGVGVSESATARESDRKLSGMIGRLRVTVRVRMGMKVRMRVSKSDSVYRELILYD